MNMIVYSDMRTNINRNQHPVVCKCDLLTYSLHLPFAPQTELEWYIHNKMWPERSIDWLPREQTFTLRVRQGEAD